MAEDDVVIRLVANVDGFVNSMKHSKAEAEKLKSELSAIFSTGIGNSPGLDKLERRLAAIRNTMDRLAGTMAARETSGLGVDPILNKRYARAERIEKRYESQAVLSQIKNATGVPDNGEQRLAALQRLNASNSLKRLANARLMLAESSKEILQAGLAKANKIGNQDLIKESQAALRRIEIIEKNLARREQIAARRIADIGRSAGLSQQAQFSLIERAFPQRKAAELFSQTVDVAPGGSIGERAKALTGRPLRELSIDARKEIAKQHKAEGETKGSPVGITAVPDKSLAPKIASGQFTKQELARYMSGIDSDQADVIMSNETLKAGVIAKAKAGLTSSVSNGTEKTIQATNDEIGKAVDEGVKDGTAKAAAQTKTRGRLKAAAPEKVKLSLQEMVSKTLTDSGIHTPELEADLIKSLNEGTGPRQLNKIKAALKAGSPKTQGDIYEAIETHKAEQFMKGSGKFPTRAQYAKEQNAGSRRLTNVDSAIDAANLEQQLRISRSQEEKTAASREQTNLAVQKSVERNRVKQQAKLERDRINQAEQFMTAENANAGYNKFPTRAQYQSAQNRDTRQRITAAGQPEKEGQFAGVFRRTVQYTAVTSALFGGVALAKNFFDTMVRMDKQLADLRKTLGGTDKDFEKLMTSAVNIARTYKSTTQDVLDAMELFSGQFKSKSALEDLSKAAILFSNLSGQSLKESAETITATMQQYEMAVSSAAHVTDAWAAMSASSAVTIKDLGDAVGAAGGAAKTAGIDFDKFNAMVSVVVAGTGKSGKEVGNAFKRIFERATSPENSKKLDDMEFKDKSLGKGIYTHTKTGEFRDFDDILGEVSQKWDKMTTSEQKNVAVLFAGARQYDSFLALMNNYGKVLTQTEKSINSLGEAERQNERIGDTFTKKVQRMKDEFVKLSRDAGTVLLPVLGKMVDLITLLVQSFNKLPTAVKAGMGAMASVAGMMAIGKLGKIVMPSLVNSGGIVGGLASATSTAAGGIKTSMELGNLSATALRLGASFLALSAAVAIVVGTAWALNEAYKALKDNTDEAIDFKEQTAKKSQDANAEVNVIISRLTDAIADRAKITDADDLDKFDKNTLSPIIQDAIKNESVKEIAPDILKGSGLAIGRYGELLMESKDSLNRFKSALENAAITIENHGISKAMGNPEGVNDGWLSKLFGKGTQDSQQIVDRVKTFNTQIALEESSRDPRRPYQKTDTEQGLRYLVAQKRSNQLNKSNIDKFINDKSPDLLKIFGTASDSAKMKLFGIAEDIDATQRANQKIVDPKIAEYNTRYNAAINEQRNARTKAEKDKAAKKVTSIENEFSKKFAPMATQSARAGMGGVSYADLIEPEFKLFAGKYTPGAAGPDSDKDKNRRIKPQKTDIPRIDFDYQKSIITNARNYAMFGGEVKLVENALQATKQAMSDMANDTNKASGPMEEMAKMAIEGKKAEIQLNMQKIQQNKKLNESAKEELVLQEQMKLQSMDEKQAVQEINGERERGIEILREHMDKLQSIKSFQEGLRGPLKGAYNDWAQGAQDSNSQLGQTNAIGQRGIGTLEAQRMFQDMQMERIKQVQSSQGYTNTARGRNEIKHQNEAIKATEKQMQGVREKNDFFGNLTNKIGNNFINQAVERQVDNLLEGLGEGLGGDSLSGLGTIFGESNPQENALNDNTKAIRDLTKVITEGGGSGGGGGIGGAISGAGLVGGFRNLIDPNIAASRTPAAKGGGFMNYLGSLVGTTLGGMFGSGSKTKSSEEKDSSSKSLDEMQGSIDKLKLIDGVYKSGGYSDLDLGSTDLGSTDLGSTDIGSGSSGSSSSASSATSGIGMLTGGFKGAMGGAAMTKSKNRIGGYGTTLGGIGGAVGGYFGGDTGSDLLGGIMGYLGSELDTPLSVDVPQLDELENNVINELRTIEKRLNTINETMESLINAPANFMLPIPQGILENSITAQSAIATPLQAGGLILKSGPAYLHKGDRVNGVSDGGGASISNSFVIHGGNNDPSAIADEVVNKIKATMYSDSQRASSYQSMY